MTPAALPFARPPRPRPEPGVCRVCGCTDHVACMVDGHSCSWVDESLCSRCHSPRRPTIRQAAELGRIRERQGPYRLDYGLIVGELVVTLVDDQVDPRFRVRPTVLTLDRDGRVVRRLERRVIERAAA